jgi:hypothetical protein
MLNAKHYVTNDHLNLLLVALEPANNNKDIYIITRLQNCVFQTEPPRNSKHLVQFDILLTV